MVKRSERLDIIVKKLGCEILSPARIKRGVSSLGDPSDIIYVGNELWKNIIEQDLKYTPETISFLRNIIYEANEKIRDLSTRDYLTGLFNRRFLDSELKKQFASTYRTPYNPFSVIMLDIDHFKTFNDTYGHNAGDVVLKTLSGIVLDSIRDSDVAFRYGGEEFLILLQNTSKADALDISYRLNHQVANTKVTIVDGKGKKHRKRITVSVGVVEINHQNPVWLLYGVRGKKLVIDYVNNDSNFEKTLDNYVRFYSMNYHSIKGERIIRKDVKIIGKFVKSYVAENNIDVSDISVTQCVTSRIIKEVDSLVYYAKECGRNRVAYIDGKGMKTAEKL